MKKTYIRPSVEVTLIEVQTIVCASVTGVNGTGNMSTSLSDDETDEYLSRHGGNDIWDN